MWVRSALTTSSVISPSLNIIRSWIAVRHRFAWSQLGHRSLPTRSSRVSRRHSERDARQRDRNPRLGAREAGPSRVTRHSFGSSVVAGDSIGRSYCTCTRITVSPIVIGPRSACFLYTDCAECWGISAEVVSTTPGLCRLAKESECAALWPASVECCLVVAEPGSGVWGVICFMWCMPYES
jgi:hypothetical protein